MPIHPIGSVEHLAGRLPELVLQRTDRQVATVGGGIQVVARQAAVEHVLARAGAPPQDGRHQRRGRLGHDQVCVQPVGHADVDVATAPGALRLDDGRQDADGGHRAACRQVSPLHVGQGQLARGRPHLVQHARQRHEVQVVTRLVRPGARLPITGDGDHHQLRVECVQASGIQAHALQHARAEAVDHHVGGGQPVAQGGEVGFVPEIDLAALLAVVECLEQRAQRTGRVAFRRLDLDDLGAQVAQHAGAERARQVAREVDHAQARQQAAQRTGAHAVSSKRPPS